MTTNFWIAFSSSFWIIPREGTEALLVVLMLCSALRQSMRSEHLSVIYRSCSAAIAAGLLMTIGCVYAQSLFTGQGRELAEAVASLIAMSMLLYVNFSIFQRNNNLHNLSIAALGFMAFISVFRELAETMLFYIALFQGSYQQKLGTMIGLIAGIALLGVLIFMYSRATERWKKVNSVMFNLTPFFMFALSVMCIGNAIGSLQEAGWIGFHSVPWMFNSDVFHIQASQEYVLSVVMFICCTGLMFIKQFARSIKMLLPSFSTQAKV